MDYFTVFSHNYVPAAPAQRPACALPPAVGRAATPDGRPLLHQLRVVRLLGGSVPGRQNGKPTVVRFTMPVTFALE